MIDNDLIMNLINIFCLDEYNEVPHTNLSINFEDHNIYQIIHKKPLSGVVSVSFNIPGFKNNDINNNKKMVKNELPFKKLSDIEVKNESSYYYDILEFKIKEEDIDIINEMIIDSFVDNYNLRNLDNIKLLLHDMASKDDYIIKKIIPNLIDDVIKRLNMQDIKKLDKKGGLHEITVHDKSIYSSEKKLYRYSLYNAIYKYCNYTILDVLIELAWAYSNYMILSGLTNDKLKDFTKTFEVLKKNNIDYEVIAQKLNDLFSELIEHEISKLAVNKYNFIYYFNHQSSFELIYKYLNRNLTIDIIETLYYMIIPHINNNKYTIKEFVYANYGVFRDFLNKTEYNKDNEEKYLYMFLMKYYIGNEDNFNETFFDLIKLIINGNIYEYYMDLKENDKDIARQKEIDRILSENLEDEISKSSLLNEYNNLSNGYEFEVFVSHLYQKLGYTCEVTSKSKDQGADIIIKKGSEKAVVQAKYYTGSVGNDAVQEVVASKAYYGVKKAIVVTNSIYTKAAINLAFKNRVELIDGSILLDIIDDITV